MGSVLWWGKNLLIAFLALFFLLLGVETMIGAFQLKNPLEFIMYFFSASFIILISLVGLIYPVFQIHGWFSPRKANHDL